MFRRHSFRKAVVRVWQNIIICRAHKGESVIQCLMLGVLAFSLMSMSTQLAAQDNATQVHKVDIHQQRVASALTQLSEQTGVQVMFPYDLARDRTANAIKGRYTVLNAAQRLLKGTGLYCGLSNKGVLMISNRKLAQIDKKAEGIEKMDTRKNILASTIAFFVGAGGVSQGYAAENTEAEVSLLLEEIVVTATKRETSLQDTAMSISAIGGETIDKRNLVGMEDYLPFIPGVSMQDRGAGQNNITIRGVGNGSQQGQTATGVYFGETPITGLGSTLPGDGAGSGDIKLVDIERVEVLKGPQGTLYGASSMGGTVRVIPNKPDLSSVEGRIATRYSQTTENGGDNTMVQAVVNLPLIEDELAIRAVGYEFNNDGYIDNVAGSSPSQQVIDAVALGGIAVDRKSGDEKYTGFRLSALWQPIDALSLSLSYIGQDIEQNGLREVNIQLPNDFQQVRLAIDENGRSEGLENELDITNLVVEYDLGWGVLVSSTSNIDYSTNSRFGFAFGSAEPVRGFGSIDSDITIQELRFLSEFEGPFQLLVGYYYEDNEKFRGRETSWYGDLSDNDKFIFDREEFLEQNSLFGELSYQLTEELLTTVGFRLFDYEKGTPVNRFNGNPRSTEGESGSVDGVNYKFNVAYNLSDDVLIYGEWAEGFRFGRFQTIKDPTADAIDDPDGDGRLSFVDGVERFVGEGLIDSDSVENYEIGIKAGFLDGRLTVNGNVFHIDWTGIPVGVRSLAGGNFFFNAGEAKSEGAEVEIKAQLSDSLVANISGSYTETVLVEDAPTLGGEKGDDLPGSADVTFNIGLEYQFMVGQYDSFARADYLYVSDYYGVINPDSDDIASGDYGLLDLKAGIAMGGFDVDLFVKNVTNANDYTWVENLWNVGRAYRLKPRTIGLNVAYSF